jgi:hypothetical protein
MSPSQGLLHQPPGRRSGHERGFLFRRPRPVQTNQVREAVFFHTAERLLVTP